MNVFYKNKMKRGWGALATSLWILTICLFCSCQRGGNGGKGNLQFDSLQVNVTEHLFGDTANPACNLVMNYAYVKSADQEQMMDSLNALLQAAALGDRYELMKPTEAVERYVANYTANYRKDLEPYLKREKEELAASGDGTIGAWYSYYRKVESRPQFYQGNLLVYAIRCDEYTGGAHGMYTTNYLNIDLRTLTPLNLEHLFVPGFSEPLSDLLWAQLMADNQVKTREELEELGYASTGELVPTDNFYLTNEGITFHYNVYDIAPYVMGAIDIALPFQMMDHLLDRNSEIVNDLRY